MAKNRLSLPGNVCSLPMCKPKTARGEDTRRRLVEVATKLIAERGIAAVRVDDVVAEVGCAHGTFYTYFRNKLDLVRQVMTDVFEELHEEGRFRRSAGACKEGWPRIGITSYLNAVDRLRPILKAFSGIVGLDAELTALRDSLLRRDVDAMASQIREDLEESADPQRLDPYLTSLALNSLIDELVRRWLLYEAHIAKEDLIELVVWINEAVFFGGRSPMRKNGGQLAARDQSGRSRH